jgi:hypothetical protein
MSNRNDKRWRCSMDGFCDLIGRFWGQEKVPFLVKGSEHGHLFWIRSVQILEDGGRVWDELSSMLKNWTLH